MDIERRKAREAAGEDVDMEDDEAEDPVPQLTKAHFEEAMSTARRSVTDQEIRRYEAFAQSMKTAGPGAFFKFPESEEAPAAESNGTAAPTAESFGAAVNEDDSLYD